MEIIGIAIVILVLITATATISTLLKDGRGHTPPVSSDADWTALDLPSVSYTLRNF
ncbi:hypothetical protein [Pseudarthrobacter sp. N5]|uniref:hypothetical protein n=1 Tax=Pseudarthrobacter sp. N5 TaxID=3418416 RepID=UPI003CF47916